MHMRKRSREAKDRAIADANANSNANAAPTMIDRAQAILVPTMRTKPPTKLDVSGMSESDLATLRRTDPFLYHSIPAVRRADLRGGDASPSAVRSSCEEASGSEAGNESLIVYRRSRLTTECHAGALLDEMLLDGLLDDDGAGASSPGFEPTDNLKALFGGHLDVAGPKQ